MSLLTFGTQRSQVRILSPRSSLRTRARRLASRRALAISVVRALRSFSARRNAVPFQASTESALARRHGGASRERAERIRVTGWRRTTPFQNAQHDGGIDATPIAHELSSGWQS